MAIQVAFSLARLFNIFKMAHAQSIGSGKLPICPRSGSGFSESFLFRAESESEPKCFKLDTLPGASTDL
jgi:hypothetical protein